MADFSKVVTFASHTVATFCPSPSHLIGVILVLVTPVKELSKMAGNLASYATNNWWIDRLYIAIELWQISYKHLFAIYLVISCHTSICFPSQIIILQTIKMSISNIYNCAWKPGFLKSSHNYFSSNTDTVYVSQL